VKFLKTRQGKKLFDAVIAQPKSNAPRTELAAWLQERGDPLGEFIALQLKEPGSKRETELRQKHEADWLGPIHAIADGMSITFERGFLSSFLLESSYWPDAKFLAAVRAATGHPALSLVTSLRLGRAVGEGGVFNFDGRYMEPPRQKGRSIPIVGFLAHPVLDRLERVTFTEGDSDLSDAVRAALTKLRPRLLR